MVGDGRCHCRGCDQARVQGAEDVAKRIRELHKEVPGRSHEETTCQECYKDYTYYEYTYPCPTIKALGGDL
jgi:hypothetical protein